jgi:anti-sigma factor RsiW
MTPIEPVELSAFLDGELPEERAQEVRTALAQDPALRQSFDQLVVLDTDWKARASAAKFRPRVRLDVGFAAGRLLVAAAVLVLLLFRIALKFQPPLLGTAVAALLLVVLVGWGLRRIMHATDADRGRFVMATD